MILAIWLLWPKWMELTGNKKPVPAPADSVAAASARTDTSALSLSASSPAKPRTVDAPKRVKKTVPAVLASRETSIAPRRIKIVTPLYTATLSNRGGVISAWKLSEYVTSRGQPVRMLPIGGRALELLVGAEGKKIDLSGAMFSTSTDAETVVVYEGDSVMVRFTCPLPDGNEVYKEWTFHADNYSARFAAGFTDPLHTDVMTLRWKGSVPPAEFDITREIAQMKAQAYVGESLEDLQVTGDDADSSSFTGSTDWVGVRGKYFLTAFAPDGIERWNVSLNGRSRTLKSFSSVNYGWEITPFNAFQSRVGGVVYMGPIHRDQLAPIGHNLDQAIDLGWSLIRPISKAVLWFFLTLHKVIPNYGWIIVIFSIFIKILVHPLTKKSYESTSKMQQLRPLMDEIKAKYSSDQQRMNQEMMKLYKEQGFNPMGGCLPMILQMPIFFAIYAVIGNNIEFRQAPFLFWVTDLSAPDVFMMLPASLPLYGDRISLLPVLMAGSMFVQQYLTVTDPKQKMMIYLMPVIMLFIFNNIASGLVLYWFMFNVLSATHQYYMTKKRKDTAAAELAAAPAIVIEPKKNPSKRRRR